MGTNQEKVVIDLKEAQEARYVAAHRKNPCIFPFNYENKTYNSCTRWHGTSPGFPDEEAFWCATSVNADSNAGQKPGWFLSKWVYNFWPAKNLYTYQDISNIT